MFGQIIQSKREQKTGAPPLVEGREWQLTQKQRDILNAIAAWADCYACIETIHVFGSVARSDEGQASDLDIAIEYVAELRAADRMTVACYTKVNADWESLAEALQRQFGHQPKRTGLSPLSEPYDFKAWQYIRPGHEIGRCGKAVLTWTDPKP
jgi:predicted nucleotidyltransferase